MTVCATSATTAAVVDCVDTARGLPAFEESEPEPSVPDTTAEPPPAALEVAMLRQLKPNVGVPLADRLELLKTRFELYKRFYSRTTLFGQKAIGVMYLFYLYINIVESFA